MCTLRTLCSFSLQTYPSSEDEKEATSGTAAPSSDFFIHKGEVSSSRCVVHWVFYLRFAFQLCMYYLEHVRHSV